MTFILNILHRDMSILAADRKAIKGLPNTAAPDMPVHAGDRSIVRDYNKITLNSSKSLALGIAGNTQDHYYIQGIALSASIDDAIWKIRKHQEGFLRIYDRASLNTLTSFMVNQGVASFFDQEASTYFTNAFRFSPIESWTRLYRGREDVQIIHAGSGSDYFIEAVGSENINAFGASVRNSCTPEACILWMRDAYMKVAGSDSGSGAEAAFVVSTRSNPQFNVIEA